MKENVADVAVVGGGIVGLAHAYMALRKGLKVVLFEREQFAIGASVRNFGLLWPVGQEPEVGLDFAFKSRMHWLEVAKASGVWLNQNGSLHLAYHEDEWAVLNEFVDMYKDAPYVANLISAEEVMKKSPIVKRQGLKGALWSATECTVNPREAIRQIPLWLQQQYGLSLRFGETVTEISMPYVKSGREKWKVDHVFVCSGADFETLYPSVFERIPITKCQLQMMKASSPASGFLLGPSLCAGLTLRHYAAFAKCPSLQQVSARYDREDVRLKEHGIHILLSQNNHGELIIGDSHHYGKTLEPFNDAAIDELILDHLAAFTSFDHLRIVERWHGIYPKLEGQINFIHEVEPGVTVVNGLGGAGMTLSFGVAEEVVSRL